jgi:hypothetical protein
LQLKVKGNLMVGLRMSDLLQAQIGQLSKL